MKTEFDWNAEQEKVSELLTKMDGLFPGYKRIVITFACSRAIAAMFGPSTTESREDFLQRFPEYMRTMWRAMDHQLGRHTDGKPDDRY
jgi:hypothetical protein